MSVTLSVPIDPLTIQALVTAGYTTLTLWAATSPYGSYSNTGATFSPTTLALMQSGTTYTATITYSGGNASMWFRVRGYDGAVAYTPMTDSAPFHGGGGTNLLVLRQKLGAEMRDMRLGTLTAGSGATTATFSSTEVTRFPTGYFNNWIVNNTTRGLWGVGSAWTSPSMTTTSIASQATGDSIELTKRFTPDEYREAINYAISACYPALSQPVIHTGILTDSQLWQYTVPNNIRSVSRVEIESGAYATSTVQATRGHPWTDVDYRLLRDGLTQTIEFDAQQTPDRRLRIRGTAALSPLVSDADYVAALEPQTDIIIFYAAFHLYHGLINDVASTDIERFEKLASSYYSRAENLRDLVPSSRPPKRMFKLSNQGMNRGKGLLSDSFRNDNFD